MKTQPAFVRVLPVVWVLAGAAGCTKSATDATAQTAAVPSPAEPESPHAAVPQDDGNVALVEAKSIMAQRCTLCHGLDGRGNGPAAANLNPKPANYTDSKWQASVDDEVLRKAIVGGGPAVGKSMMMPANPDLKDKPRVVDELVKLIRGFKK